MVWILAVPQQEQQQQQFLWPVQCLKNRISCFWKGDGQTLRRNETVIQCPSLPPMETNNYPTTSTTMTHHRNGVDPVHSRSTTTYHDVSTTSLDVISSTNETEFQEQQDLVGGDNEECVDHVVGVVVPNHSQQPQPPSQVTQTYWTQQQHMLAALYIGPVWFLANWTYNASLQQTSITSSTVLASTGSLFTFLFAILARDESFGWIKLIGVLLGVLGSCATALSDAPYSFSGENDGVNNNTNDNIDNSTSASGDDDGTLGQHGLFLVRYLMTGGEDGVDPQQGGGHIPTTTPEHPLWGDLLGLFSAVGYGGYAVQTRVLCPHDESLYSMQLILGYIGLLSLIVLSPVAIAIWFTSSSSSSQGALFQSGWVLGAIILKGLLDNVLSDFLWLRAVILTNATVATVGLGMTIPLAFLSDIVWMGKSNVLTFFSTIGAISVLVGFVLVNVGNKDMEANSSRIDTSSVNDEDDDEEERDYEDFPVISERQISLPPMVCDSISTTVVHDEEQSAIRTSTK